jgi:hypothetical protein
MQTMSQLFKIQLYFKSSIFFIMDASNGHCAAYSAGAPFRPVEVGAVFKFPSITNYIVSGFSTWKGRGLTVAANSRQTPVRTPAGGVG